MKICPPPEKHELALYSPEGGLHGYEHELAPHRNYWAKQEARAEAEVIPALGDLSMALRSQLEYGLRYWSLVEKNPRFHPLQRERVRRIALATLAISTLAQSQWEADIHIGDAIGEKRAETMVDMYAEFDETALPLEFRVHTPPVANNEPATVWYRTSTLFVRQVRPAEPTDYLRQFLRECDIAVDFANTETIYPFLPSNS